MRYPLRWVLPLTLGLACLCRSAGDLIPERQRKTDLGCSPSQAPVDAEAAPARGGLEHACALDGERPAQGLLHPGRSRCVGGDRSQDGCLPPGDERRPERLSAGEAPGLGCGGAEIEPQVLATGADDLDAQGIGDGAEGEWEVIEVGMGCSIVWVSVWRARCFPLPRNFVPDCPPSSGMSITRTWKVRIVATRTGSGDGVSAVCHFRVGRRKSRAAKARTGRSRELACLVSGVAARTRSGQGRTAPFCSNGRRQWVMASGCDILTP